MTPAPPAVLVVDDVPQILEFFQNVAERMRVAPFTLTTCSDPREALKLLGAQAFDVVVSDFRMPHHNGIELLRRARERNPAGRRVLMTGYNELSVARADIEAAAVDAYLQKPLASQEIVLLLWGLIAAEPIALDEYRKEARELEGTAFVAGGGRA